ncbi:general transcription factor II-I repeat domain-containing protein 2-like [Schistocerca piceifrons]|uniref:general transcription factor II-I repeat domain-containing protein 2-like n=1 Tax=Schistocerca piceifrons TaxID=274613 RepID=UPI001F5FA870|nr:general transcription factor II-I repeat domain-containing protein 2-like [Schistocerca piceifrons]
MTPKKTGKVGDKCCLFNEDWRAKYFFIDAGNKATCLLCHDTVAIFKEYNLKRHHETKHSDFGCKLSDEERKIKAAEFVKRLKIHQALFTKKTPLQNSATEASFIFAYNLAKRNKPFSDGEFIKQCMVECASVLCPDVKTKFESISLSRRTIARRIDLINAELTHQLKTWLTLEQNGKHYNRQGKSFLWEKYRSGETFKKQVTFKDTDSDILDFHCILHHESLCKTAPDLKHVVDPVVGVVNTIRARALHHRQFKSLLEDVGAEHEDVIYHNSVSWLSLGKVLNRVWALQDVIILFLDTKEISHDFVAKIGCEEWRYEMMFVADIFAQLYELIVTLQGKGLFAHEMWTHVKAFKTKLAKIRDYLQSLEAEFTTRFRDFKKIEPQFNVLSYPITADIDTAPQELQLVLIDMHADHTVKEMFSALTLVDFYEFLSAEKIACMKKFAGKMFSIFGYVYL